MDTPYEEKDIRLMKLTNLPPTPLTDCGLSKSRESSGMYLMSQAAVSSGGFSI